MNAEKPMLHKNISVSLGTLWRRLSPAEKRIYEIEAEREKIKHQLKFPDYKYRPRRKFKEPGEYPDTPRGFSVPSTSGFSSQKSSFDEDDSSCHDYQAYNDYSTKYSTQYHPQNYAQSSHSNQAFYSRSSNSNQACYDQSQYGGHPSTTFYQNPSSQMTKSLEQKTNRNFHTSHPSVSWQPMITTNEVAPSNVNPFGVQTYSEGDAHGNGIFGDLRNSAQQQSYFLKPDVQAVSMESSGYSQEGNYLQGAPAAVAKHPSPRLLSFEEQALMRDVKEQTDVREEQDDVIPSMDVISLEELEPVKN